MSGALYRAGSAWSGLSANARGAIWVSMGTVFAAITDLLVKTLGPTVHPVEMSFFRYFIGCLILIPLFVRVSRSSSAASNVVYSIRENASAVTSASIICVTA